MTSSMAGEEFADEIRDRTSDPKPEGVASGNEMASLGFEEGRKFERKAIIELLNRRKHSRAGYALQQFFRSEGFEIGSQKLEDLANGYV